MKRFIPFALVITMIVAAQARAVTFVDVVMDSAATLGGTTPNAGIFVTSEQPNPSTAIGGVTADHVTFWTDHTSAIPNTVTFSAIDANNGNAMFTFDLVVTGFQVVNGVTSVTGLRQGGCCAAGVDSSFDSGNNTSVSQIESAAFGSNNGVQSEFLRVSVENVQLLVQGTLGASALKATGIFGANIRTEQGQGDMGNITVAGVGNNAGATILAQWDNTLDDQFRKVFLFGPTLAIDVIPTADRALLHGLRIRFETVESAVPEPATATLGLLTFGALALRRRKHRVA